MKILFFSDDFPPTSFGGAGIVAARLATRLQELGHTVLVVTCVQDKKEEWTTNLGTLPVHRVYSKYHERWIAYRSLYNPDTIRKVKKIIADFKPDVVHAHNIHRYLSYASLKIAKQSKAKVFMTAHDVMSFHYGKLTEFVDPKDLSCPDTFDYKISSWQQIKTYKRRYNPFRNIVIRYYLQYVDKIFAVSNALKEALNQNGIGNVEVIHNGIDVNEWDTEVSDVQGFKEKHNLSDKKIILFGGRLSDAKGGKQALLLLGLVLKKIPNAFLVVIGQKNDYAQRIIEIAKQKGIEKNIIFTGWISGDELKAAYHSATLVLVPSVYLDPFPTVNLEALASKKPVIGTCFGGTPEIIIDGETGYVVNPLHTEEMARACIQLLQEPEKAKQFGNVGRKTIEDNFNLEDKVREHMVKYRLFQ